LLTAASAQVLWLPKTIPVAMGEGKTRPISFRVDVGVLDALEAAGKSPSEIARAALEREARRLQQLAALARIRENPLKGRSPGDAVTFIRRLRDTRG
jgi:hypothetical protein